MRISDWSSDVCSSDLAEPLDRLPKIYEAMMLGLRDYVNRNRFPGVVLGLSGGLDSALSAAVAVDALGPDRVRCVKLGRASRRGRVGQYVVISVVPATLTKKK